MPSLSAVRAANAAFKPSYVPVAVFLGGTSGIGQGMAEGFARYTNGDAHVIICGRNRAAAEKIIASFPKPSGSDAPVHEFVRCDATLMKNVDATDKTLLDRLPKINFLVLSPGYLTLKGRDETEEGIDKKLALNYYARWKMINDLVPLLQKAKDAGEDAKVISVLAAGKGGEIDLEDLGLKKNFSVSGAAMATPTYNDLMMEELAIRHPDLSFTHIYPGFVRTSILANMHWSTRLISPIVTGLVRPISVSQDECAEHMLYALFDAKQGAYRRGSKGEDIGKTRYFGSEEARKKLWQHTVEATTVSS